MLRVFLSALFDRAARPAVFCGDLFAHRIRDRSRFELIREQGWEHVGLVTSARHMRRALALCDSYGLEMDPLPADFRSSTRPPSFLVLIPQAAGFQAVAIVCWEYLGVLAVRLRI